MPPANGPRTTAQHESLAKALTLLSRGTPSKQSKTECRNKHFDSIARNEPGNRTQRHACLQVSQSKPNKGCGDEQRPDADPDQQIGLVVVVGLSEPVPI